MTNIRQRLPEPWPEWYRYDGTWSNEGEADAGLFDWPLTENSTVIEVGAYEGRWTERIARSYGCTVHAYEPGSRARAVATKRLEGFPNVTLWPYALGDTERVATLYDCGRDGATLWVRDGSSEPCTVLPASAEVRKFREVDLLVLNCEGAEYEILDNLLRNDGINGVRWLMIQWHGGEPEAKLGLCVRLARTHCMLWNYGYVEAWEKR